MMRALAIAALLSTSCGFAVKHPAATAAIVGGVMGGVTCEIGTDFDEHKACGVVTLGAAGLLGGVVLLATLLGGEGNTVLSGEADVEEPLPEPPSIDDVPPDAGVVAPPPIDAAPSETSQILAASALAEQYEVGKRVYTAKQCNTCHEDDGRGNAKNPPVIGPAALPAVAAPTAKLRAGVTFATAADVVGFVKAKMPIDAPGTLTDAEAHAVVAWLLDSSKVPLDRPLDATTAPTVKLRP